MAQIMAEIKGLAVHITSLSEREAENSKVIKVILTCIKKIEAHINEPEGGTCGR